jgi:TrmH family RNA methyltransferase
VGPTTPLYDLTRRQITQIGLLLKDKSVREQEGAFVLEGAKFCCDLIRSNPDAILSLILSHRYLQQEDAAARRFRSQLAAGQFSCSDALFAKLSDVETPQGMLAVVRTPQWDQERLLGQARVLALYGDRLRDPANVGVIIRTAAALNCTGLWLSPDSADPFGPKAVRAAAGTVLTLPVFRGVDARVFRQNGCSVYSALLPSRGTISLRDIREIPRRLVIAVGNEGEGLSKEIVEISAVKFAIPLSKDVESLNVAVTAAIAAFYLKELPVEA